MDHNKLKNSSSDGNIKLPYLSPENQYAGQEATVRTGMEQQTGSKLGKEYIKGVYRHFGHLTYMQSTSCELPGWMKYMLESRLLEEI